ncbi:MAG: hypothetical protein WDM88_11640 [Galbitalea sp.]
MANDTDLPPAVELPASDITATGDKDFTISLGAGAANQYFAVYGYSSATPLGWYLADGTGVITFSLPSSFPDGTHSIAVYDATGALAGWVGGVVVAATGVHLGLAPTGFDPTPLLVSGGLLVVLGAVVIVLLAARTRRRRA